MVTLFPVVLTVVDGSDEDVIVNKFNLIFAFLARIPRRERTKPFTAVLIYNLSYLLLSTLCRLLSNRFFLLGDSFHCRQV
jgi:hypothetical protein